MRLTPAFGICTEPNVIPVWATVPPAMFVVRFVDSGVLARLDAQVDVLPMDDGVTPGDIPPPSKVLRPVVVDCVVLIPDNPMDRLVDRLFVGQVVPSAGIPVEAVAAALPNNGLMPGEVSSVEPSGIPVGMTVVPGEGPIA